MNYIGRIDRAFERNQPRTVMTAEESKILINLLFSNDKNLNIDINDINKSSDTYKHFEPVINSFLAQVLLKRIELFTDLHITLGVLIMMLMYIKSPGSCVMYTYYAFGKLKPDILITLNVFSTELFPWGVFSEKQLSDIWKSQKRKKFDDVSKCVGAHDNLLDYLETWKID